MEVHMGNCYRLKKTEVYVVGENGSLYDGTRNYVSEMFFVKKKVYMIRERKSMVRENGNVNIFKGIEEKEVCRWYEN